MKINHIGFVCKGASEWALKRRKKPYEGYRAEFSKIIDLIGMQVRKNIPIATFYLLPAADPLSADRTLLMDEISVFLNELAENSMIHNKRVKVSIIGKWYNLSPQIIESIKKAIGETKEYDDYFVNFCINYDGQDEIVDATKMVARRVKLGKIDVDNVTKETVKDDLYSSYFMPPDCIFVSGIGRKLYGFLLWDSVDAEIIFLKKNFPDVNVKEIENRIR